MTLISIEFLLCPLFWLFFKRIPCIKPYFKCMKNMGFILLITTTFILVILTVLAALNFSFPLIYFLVCLGQLMLIFTVYKILTDTYSTTKTFEDFYEDHSVKKK